MHLIAYPSGSLPDVVEACNAKLKERADKIVGQGGMADVVVGQGATVLEAVGDLAIKMGMVTVDVDSHEVDEHYAINPIVNVAKRVYINRERHEED